MSIHNEIKEQAVRPAFFYSTLAGVLLLASCLSRAEVTYGPNVLPVLPNPVPLPFEEIEAEDAETTGILSEYDTAYYTMGSEASGRRYVTLRPGQSITFQPQGAYNSLVLRFSLPDSPDGRGTTARVGIASPGLAREELALSSRFAYAYGDFPWSRDPSNGKPHKFFDEANTLLSPRSAGTPLTLTLLAAAPGPLVLDLADFEQVEPIAQPEGSLNLVTDFGAVADGATDNTAVLLRAMAAARAQGKTLYVPSGEYFIGTVDLVKDIVLQGAGMWFTRFVGPFSRYHFRGAVGRLSDFAVFGKTVTRNDNSSAENAFGGVPGPGTRLERIWVEHKKCAFWVGEPGNSPPARNLTITQSRFRNLMADAVNFCNGTSDSMVSDTHIRYSGDDALATWSVEGDPPCERNSFINNTIQIPWLANGVALYGGRNHTVAGNTISDTVHSGSGIYLAAHFNAAPFTGTHHVYGNRVVRGGTALSDQNTSNGAYRLLAWDKNMDQASFVFTDNQSVDSVVSAFTIGANAMDVENVFIRGFRAENSSGYNLEIKPRTWGNLVLENSSASGGKGLFVPSGNRFSVTIIGENPGFGF